MNLIRFLPHDTTFDFMAWRHWSYPSSLVVMVLALLGFFFVGVNAGIDFSSGVRFSILFQQSEDLGALRGEIADLNLGDFQLQQLDDDRAVSVKMEASDQEGFDENAVVGLIEQLFDGRTEEISFETIGPSVSAQLVRGGTFAVVIANILVLFYLWMRFEWPFAVGAIIAIVHDVVWTLGLFVVTGLEFNLSSIAAILTIIGYSLNDTVVVFDRIRETVSRNPDMKISAVINRAINAMLPRTLMTSITTLLALFGLLIFGGDVIRSFTVAMIGGVLVGTYSSIFIAAPILTFIDLQSLVLDEQGRPIDKKSKKGRALPREPEGAPKPDDFPMPDAVNAREGSRVSSPSGAGGEGRLSSSTLPPSASAEKRASNRNRRRARRKTRRR